MRVENRTFIISGGSSGLGLATAEHLVASGAYVSILDLSTPLHTSALQRRDAKRPCFIFVKTDITNVEQVQNAVDHTVAWTRETGAELGGVINSAGIGKTELIISSTGEPHSRELWDKTLAVNLTGTFHLTRLALEHLTRVKPEEGADGERGVIIMVSSEVAYEGRTAQIAYAASKGAIRSMTLPLARDLAPHNIRAITISPGLFTTPLTDTFSKRVHSGMSESLLYPRRYGTPKEFAATVKWVLDCPYVNGEIIRLTGGERIPARL